MGAIDERQEPRAPAAQARDVAWAAEGTPWQRVLRPISGGRWGRPPTGWTVIRLDAPWQDTPFSERPGWREHAAHLADDVAFAVDCTVCTHCRLGWVEQPCTMGTRRVNLARLHTRPAGYVRAESPNPLERSARWWSGRWNGAPAASSTFRRPTASRRSPEEGSCD